MAFDPQTARQIVARPVEASERLRYVASRVLADAARKEDSLMLGQPAEIVEIKYCLVCSEPAVALLGPGVPACTEHSRLIAALLEDDAPMNAATIHRPVDRKGEG